MMTKVFKADVSADYTKREDNTGFWKPPAGKNNRNIEKM
jgi:hypothetical protein